MGVEVREGVVILHGVSVLVHWGEVGVGGFSGVWGRGSISWRSCGGGASCCEKSGRKESLKIKSFHYTENHYFKKNDKFQAKLQICENEITEPLLSIVEDCLP